MKKTYYFLSGLPRSGNTLLSAILNQNPNIYSSPLSPVLDLMWEYSKSYNYLNSIKRNQENRDRGLELLSSFFDTFYKNVEKPIVFDRQKDWGMPGNLDLIKKHITKSPKIIVTVRDILEILASFIQLDSDRLKNDVISNNAFVNIYRSDEDCICEYLMQTNGDIDRSLVSVASAFYLENRDIFHIVEYNDLISKPQETMSGIYKFLELPDYNHDFNNIKKIELDNDIDLGYPENLHHVRESLSRSSTSVDILSDYIKHKYSNMEFWRDGSLMKVKGKDF
jgi:sulfotransferase